MKKVKVCLYDKYFRPVLCSKDIYNTKVIDFLFDSCDKDLTGIMSALPQYSMKNQISINSIFAVLDALEYSIEADNVLKLNQDFKSKPFKVDSIRQWFANDCNFKFSICIDLFQTEVDDSMKRYLANDIQTTYDLHSYMPRGSGKTQTTRLMLNGIYGLHTQEGGNKMINILPNPKRVICSGPVTTVIYGDGSKTHVRKTEDDENDYEKAFLLSWLYKTYGKSIVEKKLKEFKSEFVEPEEPAYMGAVAEALNHVLKMSIGKKK